jgi:hypothetical protein
LRKISGYERQSRNGAFIYYSSKGRGVGLNQRWLRDNLRILKFSRQTHSRFDFNRFSDINFEIEEFQGLKIGFARLQFIGARREEKKAESPEFIGYCRQSSTCARVGKPKSRARYHGTGWVENLNRQSAGSGCLA